MNLILGCTDTWLTIGSGGGGGGGGGGRHRADRRRLAATRIEADVIDGNSRAIRSEDPTEDKLKRDTRRGELRGGKVPPLLQVPADV